MTDDKREALREKLKAIARKHGQDDSDEAIDAMISQIARRVGQFLDENPWIV